MATAIRQIEAKQPTGTALAPIAQDARAVVFVDKTALDDFLAKHRGRAAHISKDASTKQGRQEMQSFETDMRAEKAKIDRDRKAVTKDMRDVISKVNEQGNEIEATLDALINETCEPLFAYKLAEKARIAECEATIERLKSAALIMADDTLETILQRGAEVKATVIDAERYGKLFEPASEAKKAAFYALKDAHGRLTKEAEERAEAKRVADRLAELEAENAAREARERAEREAAEAVERERREAEEQRQRDIEEAHLAEKRRIAAEQAEAERIRLAEEAAATAAREEAARLAQEERDRERAEHEAALTREREAREKVEREAREAEEARIAEAARVEEARNLAEAAEAKRIANIAHRTRVRTGIEQAFMARGADDDTAHKIAGDIIAGLIANLEVKF